ncbi:MAG TPA: TMEM14 family protein [Candidatus Acidoferrum sp.]|nr:TMEM14 family protein [Candidatus Acidoferrum sp.]
MKPEVILWIYIALLLIGGLIGFLKAKSKISLIMSLAFAVLLGICAVEKLRVEWSWGILSFLALIFFLRFLKTKKFMPSGMMLLVTLATIVAMVWFK